MPAKTKVQNLQEVLDWIQEGRTYKYMIEQYEKKYGIQTTVGMFSEIRRKYGLDRRQTQDDALVPWRLEPHHRFEYPAVMLRFEARRRAGKDIDAKNLGRLKSWLKKLEDGGLVVDYDPATKDGFSLVPRQPSDVDIVRTPRQSTGKRRGELV
jgi:hypothetical protein